MTAASAWTTFVHWFDKDTLNLLSSLGSFGAALCAVAAAGLARQQHLDGLAGAPTVETLNHRPRIQLSFRERLWDGMGDPSVVFRNIGSGAMLHAQVTARLRPVIGPDDPLPPGMLLQAGDDAFAIRPDQRAVSKLHRGVEQEALPIRMTGTSEIFELAPNATFKFWLPFELQTWWLAHASLVEGARISGEPSAILELEVRYRTAGAKRRRRRFDLAMIPLDLGPVPPDAPSVFGANLEYRLIKVD